MDDFTRKFSIAMEKDAEIHQILSTVYQALEEKGYNPINQIVGYILSEDPTYITEALAQAGDHIVAQKTTPPISPTTIMPAH